MMKYVIIIPQSNFATSTPIQRKNTSYTAAYWSGGSSGIESPTAQFFPLHKSLEDEINRLFAETNLTLNLGDETEEKNENDIMEDFKNNGKDTEYLPPEEEVQKPLISRRRKNKKPLPTECVFCKNNGETTETYKGHILKDADGKVKCPILRKYQCPICGVMGDNSHTRKYCPQNTDKESVPVANTLKGLRNATGKRRSK
ncbi:nanos homolog 3 [Belonocnema kinseyi]|uniref:nanos homolog 3 n=1 Tax=Belonocnema kinseyi TaxID=2817044 RepID=UPI00143CD6A8|nr:nanos homolog 3 [Belonocnema kinseyi]